MHDNIDVFDIYKLKYIETPRTIIRPVKAGDEYDINVAIQATLNDLQRWMPWAKDPSFASTKSFVDRAQKEWLGNNAKEFPMIVEHKQDHRIISVTGYNDQTQHNSRIYEIGYWLHKNYHGQGLMSECVVALTRFALEALQAQHVQICMQVDNTQSYNLAKRCGFHLKEIQSNNRKDYLSGKITDSAFFICNRIEQLPDLEVSWK